MKIDRKFLTNLKTVGVIEGISTLVLFGIAMPLKYMADIPLAVRIVGPIHGALFVTLAVMFMLAVQRVPISRTLAAGGIFAAVVPFGPFVFARWLDRVGTAVRQST
jgi:integral membrane protein